MECFSLCKIGNDRKNTSCDISKITRLAVVLLLTTLIQVSARAEGQTITLSGSHITLKKALTEIEHQSGVAFLWPEKLINSEPRLDVHFKNYSLTSALNEVLKNLPLSYKLENNLVYIVAKSDQGEASDAAQPQMPVHGKVTDSLGHPLVGVTVRIRGTSQGTATDGSGDFQIQADTADYLVFSYLGYDDRVVKVNSEGMVNVTLSAQRKNLKEITVVGIGYGTLDKREVSSAITHIDAKDLLTGSNNDPMMSLQGKVAGLTVTNTAAADPNSLASLQLRGVSSRSAGLGPLYVIDGVPGGNIDNVNQDAIASIDVLKGGAASAIYGTRGSNGVILITTKKGSTNPSVLYDVYGTLDFPTNTLHVLSSKEFLAHKRGPDGGSNTNWLDAVTRSFDFSQKHTLQFSGGSPLTNYIATMDYRNTDGLDLRSSKKEYGARLNLNHSSKNDLYSITLNVAPRYAKTNVADYNNFNWALTLNPTLPIYDSSGNFNYINSGLFASNPVELAKKVLNQQEIKEMDMNASFKLNILKNLNTVITIGEISQSLKSLSFSPSDLSTTSVANGGNGRNNASQSQQENDQQSLEWVGNYSLHVHRHSLQVLGGYSYQSFNYQEFDANNQDIPFDALTWNDLGGGSYDQEDGIIGMGSNQNSSKLIAFFGRAIYNYDEKYILTASLRHEGSTKFGASNKWGNFPAVSAAWVLSDEKFMQGTASWLNQLKLRADYGQTGNQDFPSYQSLLTYGGYGFYSFNGTYYQDYGPSQNVNPFLHWEKGININIGLDFSLFDRITGSLNYYTRKNKDLLGSYNVPIPPNLQPTTYVNVGSMNNSGIEIQITANVIHHGDFSYDVTFAGNTNNNKFLSFSNQLYNGGTYLDGVGMPAPGSPGPVERLQEGKRVGSFYTLHAAGVDSSGALEVYSKDGKIIPATQASNDDKRFVGNGLPKFMASLGNSFRYRNWDLSIYLRGAFGYKIFNTYAFYLGTPAQQLGVNLLKSAYDGSKYSKLTNSATSAILSDYFLEPGNFVKIDNISLGYTKQFGGKSPIQSLRIYATGRNLHTFTKYTGGDPDLVPINGLWPGINQDTNHNGTLSYYPSAIQVMLGLQVRF